VHTVTCVLSRGSSTLKPSAKGALAPHVTYVGAGFGPPFFVGASPRPTTFAQAPSNCSRSAAARPGWEGGEAGGPAEREILSEVELASHVLSKNHSGFAGCGAAAASAKRNPPPTRDFTLDIRIAPCYHGTNKPVEPTMTNLTPLNDNRLDAATTWLQATFAARVAPTLREQTLFLTHGTPVTFLWGVAPHTPRASPPARPHFLLTRARAYA
jgi:hypothetical protein